MIKIIGDTGAFKELKNKLHINNLKEFELLPEKLENKKIELLENGKKQCSDDLNGLKVDLEKSRHDLGKHGKLSLEIKRERKKQFFLSFLSKFLFFNSFFILF